jgi:hypothetical protein
MSAETDLDGFLAKFEPPIEAQARAALSWMQTRIPGAKRLVYDNYNALAIGFGANEKLSGVVFSIAVYPRWVSLFFSGGPRLSDPLGLLKGTGDTVRHIVLTKIDLLNSKGVEALIAAALARADPQIDQSQPGALIIKSISAKQRPRRPAA